MVTWEPKWEAANSFCDTDHPEQVKLAAAFAEDCDELDTINLARDNHQIKPRQTRNMCKEGAQY